MVMNMGKEAEKDEKRDGDKRTREEGEMRGWRKRKKRNMKSKEK